MYEVQDFCGFRQGDQWAVRKNGQVVFTGGFRATVRHCVLELGFDIQDFDRSIQSLIYNGHNVLHFDRHKKLTATSYQSPVNQKKRA